MAFKETTSEVAKSSGNSKLEVNPNKRLSPGVRETKPETSDASDSEAVNPNKRIEPAHAEIHQRGAEPISTYKDRFDKTPRETSPHGLWEGGRAESLYVPSDVSIQKSLARFGLRGIEYKNAKPDFSPVADTTVKIKGFTDVRDGGKSERSIPGNYDKADAKCAEQWNKDSRDGRTNWTAREVEGWRGENKYTWHECNDMKTMQLVPADIHRACNHYGGVAEYKKLHGTDGGFDD